MGLNQEGSSNRTYLSISDGKIARRVPEGTAGSIKCNSKDGTSVWYEQRFASLSGHITDVFKRVSEKGYGDQLCIVLKDGGEEYQIQMPWSSRYSSGFFLCMPNITQERKLLFLRGQSKLMEKLAQCFICAMARKTSSGHGLKTTQVICLK